MCFNFETMRSVIRLITLSVKPRRWAAPTTVTMVAMSTPDITIIVAYDLSRGIGAANDLLWQRDLPTDMRHFRDITTGNSIIMGRNTFESIGRALPGRQNIVVTHRPLESIGIETAPDLQSAYALATGRIYVIGGGSIYEQALPDANTVFATEVSATFPQATVFFPELDSGWRETSRQHHPKSDTDKYDFDFVEYKRG